MGGCNCNKGKSKKSHINIEKTFYRPKSKSKHRSKSSHNKVKKHNKPKKYKKVMKHTSPDVLYNDSDYVGLTTEELRSWDRIHSIAANAITVSLKIEFEKYIRYLSYNFPCPKCRPHIKKRLASYPIKTYYNIFDSNGRDIGIAKWSWEFHNDVNSRTNKPLISWESFVNKYL